MEKVQQSHTNKSSSKCSISDTRTKLIPCPEKGKGKMLLEEAREFQQNSKEKKVTWHT